MPEFLSLPTVLISGSFLQQGSRWALSTLPGFPPVIQTVHILGIAVVMGTVVLLNLRVLGLVLSSQNLARMTDRVMPWFWIALLSNLISGAFFVLASPARYFNNPVFAVKLGILVSALLLQILFLLLHKSRRDYWEQDQRQWLARAIALLSIALWIGVCTSGRWIAYHEYLLYPLWTIEPYFDGSESGLWAGIENWGLSQIIAATNWFPTLETIHVIAAAMLVGTIAWIDLRLLGLAAIDTPFPIHARELVRWIWGAFVLSVITGLGMFITRAATHLENPAFMTKGVLLALAGANMAWFHIRLSDQVDQAEIPASVRIAGFSSLVLWCGVMLAGRWVGHIV